MKNYLEFEKVPMSVWLVNNIASNATGSPDRSPFQQMVPGGKVPMFGPTCLCEKEKCMRTNFERVTAFARVIRAAQQVHLNSGSSCSADQAQTCGTS